MLAGLLHFELVSSLYQFIPEPTAKLTSAAKQHKLSRRDHNVTYSTMTWRINAEVHSAAVHS